ncbi:MAG: GspH/FimT family pseudopilin [Woeseiaceae bacterium]|nr:GspH/FimT family pseudopilin [Woeseiaceae bacterium]
MPHTTQGFTLYELLLTMSLAAILVSTAVPAFGIYIAKSRQSVEINALFHAVHRARKASIMRRKVVSICPSRDGRQCGTIDDWSSGWLLFENTDADDPPRVDAGEPLLATHPVDAAVAIDANRRGFTLRATVKRATNGTLIVCDRSGRAAPRALVVSYTGRPRIARERPDGSPYICPNYVK